LSGTNPFSGILCVTFSLTLCVLCDVVPKGRCRVLSLARSTGYGAPKYSSPCHMRQSQLSEPLFGDCRLQLQSATSFQSVNSYFHLEIAPLKTVCDPPCWDPCACFFRDPEACLHLQFRPNLDHYFGKPIHAWRYRFIHHHHLNHALAPSLHSSLHTSLSPSPGKIHIANHGPMRAFFI
jgi:hypothetical protein